MRNRRRTNYQTKRIKELEDAVKMLQRELTAANKANDMLRKTDELRKQKLNVLTEKYEASIGEYNAVMSELQGLKKEYREVISGLRALQKENDNKIRFLFNKMNR